MKICVGIGGRLRRQGGEGHVPMSPLNTPLCLCPTLPRSVGNLDDQFTGRAPISSYFDTILIDVMAARKIKLPKVLLL